MEQLHRAGACQMGHQRRERSISELLDDIDVKLTGSSKSAASVGDDMLVYLLDMAILHVRKKAVQILGVPEIYSVGPIGLPVAAE